MLGTIRCARSVGEGLSGDLGIWGLGHCQRGPAPCFLCLYYSVFRAKEEAVSVASSGTLSSGFTAQTRINRKDWT